MSVQPAVVVSGISVVVSVVTVVLTGPSVVDGVVVLSSGLAVKQFTFYLFSVKPVSYDHVDRMKWVSFSGIIEKMHAHHKTF